LSSLGYHLQVLSKTKRLYSSNHLAHIFRGGIPAITSLLLIHTPELSCSCRCWQHPPKC
jgi:hypothetical protein